MLDYTVIINEIAMCVIFGDAYTWYLSLKNTTHIVISIWYGLALQNFVVMFTTTFSTCIQYDSTKNVQIQLETHPLNFLEWKLYSNNGVTAESLGFEWFLIESPLLSEFLHSVSWSELFPSISWSEFFHSLYHNFNNITLTSISRRNSVVQSVADLRPESPGFIFD